MRGRTIAYVSETHPNDRHSWSGTVHFVFTALQRQGYNVVPLGPAVPGTLRLFWSALNQVSLRFFHRRIDYRHSRSYSRAFGRIFSRKLRTIHHDLVVVCGSTECGAYIRTSRPIVYVLDRTIAGALGYHAILTQLWSWSQQQSIYTDKRAMASAELLIFSSDWAAQHAEKLYGIDRSRIAQIPFGANLDRVPERNELMTRSEVTEWKLLLVGTSWQNKGADIAVNAVRELRSAGINASLTVVGCRPPHEITEPGIAVIPFISKNSTEGAAQLDSIFRSHHLFILPTRFDCTPIVFCEASAYGMPVLSSDTGGVAAHVHEGQNGFLIPYNDNGPGFAAKIAALVRNQAFYWELRATTRSLYESRLNWTRWAEDFAAAAERLQP